ncbi:lipoate--protein ligase family protein [Phragmitibacter flavus]|uniref:Lipoate--protein ligase family protein n=1 Tax=Phragmitibacter flavus TaxID=2576071 RepID=A0A5R8KD23_9BACT|nr:lipoate--protein ligase family protein [Phragmitibacter flavus]TLD70147.1 lipoate--protein ligase family protein [Phragmitibacter flavus]
MLLDTLSLWLDATPHDAALNMAIDEAMLLSATGPWMRVYRWEKPSLSIGFSQNLSLVPAGQKHWPLVRRWTGGGVVVHDGDWTYTLGSPPGTPLFDERATETYRWIHQAMINAMDHAGLPGGQLQPENTSDGMGVCFVEPAKFDVVWQNQKIAGAAQRRTRQGFLHQGSVQQAPLPSNFGTLFASQLAKKVVQLDDLATITDLLPAAQLLIDTKYGTESWTTSRTVQPQPAVS